jgi:hypothetical protein
MADFTDPLHGEDVDVERVGPGGWTWVYQGPSGSFFRGVAYKSASAARKAGRDWLKKRLNPRMRGR